MMKWPTIPPLPTHLRRIGFAGSIILVLAGGIALAQSTPSSVPATASQSATSKSGADLPRGKKLMLKDGSYQLIREYQMDGDRVRYYSLDSSQWEEMPADLVDWDKTKKVEADEAKQEAAQIGKAKHEESEREAQLLDVDASIQLAPGVFLPQGEGLFAFDGKTVLKLAEAHMDSRLSPGNTVERVMVPVPIVPTRHNISIDRPHAEYRVTNGQPEFYMRISGAEPELELIRAVTRGETRQVEQLDEAMGRETFKGDKIAIQRWTIAPNLYRFTLSTPLSPGEYVLAEAIDDNGLHLYLWDFGVDPPEGTATIKRKRKN